jgi:hypothetical protein
MGHSDENPNSNLLNIKELKPDLTVNLDPSAVADRNCQNVDRNDI